MEESDRVAEELSNIVPGRVVRNVKDYLRDWWPLYQVSPEEGGAALVAVKPLNVDEIVRVVKFAASNRLSLLCRGGGSSVTGASVPQGGIVVDLTGMDNVLDIDEGNRTVTLQAGTKLKEAEERVKEKGFTMGQVPQSFELATVGGYISTMGTGQYSALYGGIEDSVLRLQVVLPDGEVIWTRKRDVPRSSVGPDLARLFVGAEGMFGMVTAAQLKLHRLPRHTWKMSYVFQSFPSAVSAARNLMDLDVRPAVCRVYNELESSFQFGNAKPIVLLVYFFGSQSVMKAVADEVREVMVEQEGGVQAESTLVDTWMEKRFAFREQLEAMRKMGYMVDTVEIAAKWSRLFDLYDDVMTELARVEGVGAIGAHASHFYQQGACIYFTMLLKPQRRLYDSVWSALGRITERHDATISHHHGVGILKAGFVERETSRALLRKIKGAIDPGWSADATTGKKRKLV